MGGTPMFLASLFHWQDRAAHVQLGMDGEDIAAKHLRRSGYRIVRRNLRVGTKDEIDILAYDPKDDVYVFAEVKTRARLDPDYEPEMNATQEKREHMARAARRWMDAFATDVGYRLDLICVAEGRVVGHYEDIDH